MARSLVGKILEDAKGQPDMLPLLSDFLLELYSLRSRDNVVTFAADESLGDKQRTGLEGALSKRAEKKFAKTHRGAAGHLPGDPPTPLSLWKRTPPCAVPPTKPNSPTPLPKPS